MKRIIYIINLIFLLCSGFCDLSARDRVLRGTVKDSQGNALPGVVVMVEGHNDIGVVSDLDGVWELSCPDKKELRIVASCMGYVTTVVEVSQLSVVDVVLKEDTIELEETVVVGYGAMRRSDLTGSVTSVKIDEDNASRSSTLDQLLLGQAAGVNVMANSAAPGAGISILIRGVSSLNGNNQPLYVVDGVILTSESTSVQLVGEDMNEDLNPLSGINPQDIASIEVLKDASATAIYGAEGANGVILITTKDASRERPSINVNVGLDMVTPQRKIEVLSFDEYVSFLTDVGATTELKRIFADPSDPSTIRVSPVDWQDYALKEKLRQRYFFSVSGKPQSLKYTFSFGYNNTPGIVQTTGSEQYTMRANLSKSFGKKLRIDSKFNLGYISTDSQQGVAVGTNSSSLIKGLVTSRPYFSIPIDDEDDDDETMGILAGPDMWFKNAYINNDKYKITYSLSVDYKILPWLSFKSSFGLDYNLARMEKWKGKEISRSNGAQTGIAESIASKWTFDNQLNFNKKHGRHRIYGTLGMTMGRHLTTAHGLTAQNLIQDGLQSDNINSAHIANISYSEKRNSNLSVFTRIVYDYADRYVLTATYRLDGSSMFVGKNVFSSFPSAAFAWRVNQESWFDCPVISMLKLRLGWGQVGNSNAGPYATYNLYSSTSYANHFDASGYISGGYPSVFVNPDLKWETTRQWNAGIDFSMYEGRIALSVDAYDKTTYDLLQAKMVPYTSGYTTRWVNQGTINNKGLEITLELTPVATKMVEWNVSGNISFNRNELVDLGFEMGEKDIYIQKGQEPQRYSCYEGAVVTSGLYMSQPANIFIEGMPIGLFYGYRTDGIVPEGKEGIPISASSAPQQPGQINYVDMNENGYLDDGDKTVIGSCRPDFTYGFSTNLKLWRFRIGASFNGVYGREIFNANAASEYDTSFNKYLNVRKDAYYNAWTPQNQDTKVFKLIGGWATGGSNTERGFVTDRYIEDGSYLKLSSLSLSFSVPLPKNKVLRSLDLGVSATDVYVWTNYSGWDPSANSFGASMTRMGIDSGSYPPSRAFCFDCKFTF